MAKKYASDSTLSALVAKIKELFATKSEVTSSLSGKADSSHTHSISDTTNLQTTLDSKVPTSRTVNGKALSANITLSASDVGADSSGSASAVQENLDTVSDTLSDHTSNADIHFTETERTKLSGIETGAQVNTVTGVKGNSESSYRTGNINITKANIGLGNVDNTADSAKSVNYATSAGSATSATKATQDASGNVITSTYETKTDASSKLAESKTYTDTAISNLINSAPTTLDTLGEIATAMAENEDVVEALETAVGTKANASDLTSHTSNTSNPHGVTLAQLGVTATAAELNKLDGVTATTTELNYVDGATSNIQAQIDGKADSTHNHAASEITSGTLSSDRLPTVPITKGGTGATTASGALTNLGITATAAELNILDGVTATTAELNYVDGVTSNIQTQLNNKLATSTASSTYMTIANPVGTGSFSMNRKSSTTVGNYSHAEGLNATASGQYSHAEGYGATASGTGAHAEGSATTASATYSHAEGIGSTASKNYSHAEGYYTTASGASAHSEGDSTTASGSASHSEGDSTTASGNYSHSEGYNTKATTTDDEVATTTTVTNGHCAHAEGYGTVACGSVSHAEGNGTKASGFGAHAEGKSTIASGSYSHAEGNNNTASGSGSHAEGSDTTASGSDSHAEGYYTTASGNYSHAEGGRSTTSAAYSHAEGYYTIASQQYQHVQGKYNIEDTEDTYAHIVGNGKSSARSNAHTLDWDGNAWFAGNIYVGGDSQSSGSTMLSSIATVSTAEYTALEEAEATNANTLYMITDAEEEVIPTIQFVTWEDDD